VLRRRFSLLKGVQCKRELQRRCESEAPAGGRDHGRGPGRPEEDSLSARRITQATPAPPLAAARERILVLIKESLNLPLEFNERKWLDDVVVASSVNTPLNIGGLEHCRGGEDRNIRSVRICA
jgi:hypothetical protein